MFGEQHLQREDVHRGSNMVCHCLVILSSFSLQLLKIVLSGIQGYYNSLNLGIVHLRGLSITSKRLLIEVHKL